MNYSNYRISLDVQENGSGEMLNAKKGDTGRKLFISLTDGGLPYRLTEDCFAVFTAVKPDDHIIFNECTLEGNTIVYRIKEQTLACAGKVKCEIRIYGADGMLITSAGFTMLVDDTVYTDGDEIESTDDFSALTKLLTDMLALKLELEGLLGGGTGEGGNQVVINKFVEELVKNETVINKFADEIAKNETVVQQFVEEILKDESVVNQFIEEVFKNETFVNKFVEELLKEESVVNSFVEQIVKDESVINSFVEEIAKNDTVVNQFLEEVLKDETVINSFVEEIAKNDTVVNQFLEEVLKDETVINNFVEEVLKDENVVNSFVQEAVKNETVINKFIEEVLKIDGIGQQLAEALPKVSAVDFSNFENGSFSETVDGEAVTHSVVFDISGRPVLIDNIAITWG